MPSSVIPAMAEKDIKPEEVTQLSKRAYVRGFVNTLRQAEKSDEVSTEMAKKAVAHREQLYSEETSEILEKRANAIADTVREIAGKKKEAAAA